MSYDFELCSSLVFQLTNESAIYDVLQYVFNAWTLTKILVSQRYRQFLRRIFRLFLTIFRTRSSNRKCICNVHSYKVSSLSKITVSETSLMNFRKELRSPYNIVFLVMALDQALAILSRDILIWLLAISADCKSVFLLKKFQYTWLLSSVSHSLCSGVYSKLLWLMRAQLWAHTSLGSLVRAHIQYHVYLPFSYTNFRTFVAHLFARIWSQWQKISK